MSAANSPTLSLLHSAFGPRSTLYTVLQCTQSSTPVELKRAYRKAALRHHPDRCGYEEHGEEASSSTLKFQALSAAYRILMDERRRSAYDATGQILEEGDDISCNRDDNHASRAPSSNSKARGTPHSQRRQWEQFFHSIFDEMISTGSRHSDAASVYRGSEGEKSDVLHYYTMCKGDMAKVAECMIHGGSDGDVVRWKREIVDPAVERGEVDDCCGCKKRRSRDDEKLSSSSKWRRRTILEDESSSDDEDITKVTSSSGKSERRQWCKSKQTNNSFLIDTEDEEEDGEALPKKQLSPSTSTTTSMSKRDKMNYRVAKKRKARAANETEMADIIRSKNWDDISTAAAKHDFHQRRMKKNMNAGGISNALISDIEKRYGEDNSKRKRKKR